MPAFNNEADIMDEAKRKQAIQYWMSQENLRRKDEAFKVYELLKDRTNNYVMDLLLKMFDYETVYEMQYSITNISVLRKIVDKLAKVYSNGAKRSMPKEEESEEAVEAGPPPKLKLPGAPAPAEGEAPAEQGAAPEETEEKVAPEEGEDEEQPSLPGLEPEIDPETGEALDPQAAALKAMEEIQDPETKALEDFAKYLKLDEAMRKTNRYMKAMHNTLVFPKPVNNGEGKFNIQIEVIPPFHYDAIESPYDPTQPLAIVLSDYTPGRRTMYYIGDEAKAGRTKSGPQVAGMSPDGSPAYLMQQGTGIVKKEGAPDEAASGMRFTWWSKTKHFVTDMNGKIIPTVEGEASNTADSGKNPIQELPFVNFCGEQDNCFWADGGKDLAEGAIAINVDLTNLRNIATTQGYGILWLTGENLPKAIKIGPQHAINLEYKKDENPEPKIGFLNANAPIGDLLKVIEMYVAFLLSTNNLSVSHFASNLSGGKDFASGIAMMIDKAESMDDINEQAKVFIEKEPKVLDIAAKWMEKYKAKLTDEAKQQKPPKNIGKELVSFPPPKPIVSEKEELEAIKMRKELGLNTMVDLIQRDNPGISTQEAIEKLEKIQKEKKANAAAFAPPPGAPGVNPNVGNQGQEGNGQQQPNGNKPGFGPQQAQASGGNEVPNQG